MNNEVPLTSNKRSNNDDDNQQGSIACRIKKLKRKSAKTSYNDVEKGSKIDKSYKKQMPKMHSIKEIDENEALSDQTSVTSDDLIDDNNEFLRYIKKLSKLKQKKAEHGTKNRLFNQKINELKKVESQNSLNFLNPTLAALNYDNLYYCNFCGFSADNTNKLLQHLFIHVFKCQLCSHFTYTKYDLLKHIYKNHRQDKELKVKRMVLEVSSNDWYFLCSENEPHSINGSSHKNSTESLNKEPVESSSSILTLNSHSQQMQKVIIHNEISSISTITNESQPQKSHLLQLMSTPSRQLVTINPVQMPSFKTQKATSNNTTQNYQNTVNSNEHQAIKTITKVKKTPIDLNDLNNEIKKDIESIKLKFSHLNYKYSCKLCNFEVNDVHNAYLHLVQNNTSHEFKCIACQLFNCDNISSFKMHLLAKHKLFAQAEKLLNEFFTIRTFKNEILVPDQSLDSLILKTINQDVNESSKNVHLKRALNEAYSSNSLSLAPSYELTQNTPKRKKFRLQINEDPVYYAETSDNGSINYVCSKCKIIFLNLNSLKEHKCDEPANIENNKDMLDTQAKVLENDVIYID